MSLTPQRPGSSEEDINPHRASDRNAVEAGMRATLRQRGATVREDESSDELADLAEAVERFERARSALGGDSMINAPDTRKPERAEFVLPQRTADESARQYVNRIAAAADRLR